MYRDMQTSSFDDTIPYIIYHPGSVRQVLFLENQNTTDVIPVSYTHLDMDFSGSSLDVAVNAIIGSMLQNGYLNELANSVLISVDNNDPVSYTHL